MKDSERIEIPKLVGRYIRVHKVGVTAKINQAMVWCTGEVRVLYMTPTYPRGTLWEPLGDHTLLPADWTPPEPEPERKADDEVDPLALELRRFLTHSLIKPLDLGATQPEKYTAEAARIRAMLGATVEHIRLGKKVVHKEGSEAYYYCSPWAGRNDWGTGMTLNFAVGEWTKAPPSGGITIQSLEEAPQKDYVGLEGVSVNLHVARCVYVPGGKRAGGCSKVASRVMLIEEPVPVAQSKPLGLKPDAIYVDDIPAEPSADEVRELADELRCAYDRENAKYCFTALAKAALAHFRRRSPLRVCTVSDEELGTELCRAYNNNRNIVSGGFLWERVVRRAKQLLLGDDAVKADYVVRRKRSGPQRTRWCEFKPLTQKAENCLRPYYVDACGWYPFNSEAIPYRLETLLKTGCIGLLDENWKGSVDVKFVDALKDDK